MSSRFHQPTRDTVTTINEDGSRYFIHPSDVEGRLNRWRKIAGYFLIALYVLLPWIPVNGNPAVFIDVANRQFHLFGLTFAPQDLWLAFFLITGLGFSLFFVTALIGRVWCGWACPQTVFIEQVFRRIERLIEGDAARRRMLDTSPWTPEKIARRGTKMTIFAVLSVLIAHIFLSYFVSIPRLYSMMGHSPLANWGPFLFVFVLSGILFFNFAWFREQFCIVLCPYGRLQSALIDNDSYVIGYDPIRGEPRGKPSIPGVGDCIDCFRCVQVCPTGIDIRQGLQMECVSCGNCIDACNAVMRKLDRPEGLIRYDSTNRFEGEKTRIIRPRIVLYSILLCIGVVVMTFALSTIRPVTASVLRMPGAPYYEAEGQIRNQYTLRVVNKRSSPQEYDVSVTRNGRPLKWTGFENPIAIGPNSEELRPLIVSIPTKDFGGKLDLAVSITTRSSGTKVTREIPFIGPKTLNRSP